MVGDRIWLDGLTHRYHQHLADCVRAGREPMLYERWAVRRTWEDFLALEEFANSVGDFTRDDWATANAPWAVPPQAFSATVLAREAISAVILVGSALCHVKRRSRAAHRVLERRLEGRRIDRADRPALARAKRIIYGYLRHMAQSDS